MRRSMKSCIGQDLESIKEHFNYFGPTDMVMFYTNLTQIKGLTNTVDYGSGIQSLKTLRTLYNDKTGDKTGGER